VCAEQFCRITRQIKIERKEEILQNQVRNEGKLDYVKGEMWKLRHVMYVVSNIGNTVSIVAQMCYLECITIVSVIQMCNL
jgi:hypothetical protein